MARALSDVLGRKVTIEFLPRQRPPVIRLDGEIIPLDLLGEGFRRTLAWLSDLCARLELTPWKDTARSPFDQDFWLLLDEIDQSIHPALQRHILPALRRLFPNARIYATTHSPFVVASAPDGCVFPIRPDPANHRVHGPVAPVKLGPGPIDGLGLNRPGLVRERWRILSVLYSPRSGSIEGLLDRAADGPYRFLAL